MQKCEQAKLKTGEHADPSLRWHDPDQVQRVRLLRHLSPHGTPLGCDMLYVIHFLITTAAN